jgi:nicotinate-nucleotide adenylyltransferase
MVKQVALFGTSADPPTRGHQRIIQWLSFNFDYVAIWTADNPFKRHGSTLVQRFEMLRLLCQELGPQYSDRYGIYPELSHERTIHTVNAAGSLWPDSTQFNLVIGADLGEQIVTWYQAQELLKLVKLIILPRPGHRLDPQALARIEALGGCYDLPPFEPIEAASSSYHHTKEESLLTPAIAAYIKDHNLYS